MEILATVLQVIVALGLLNVWLIRARKSTPYRGGESETIKEEFATYDLPAYMMYLVGGLKILIAIAMIAGIWIDALLVPAGSMLMVLMIGAYAMHLKVKDPVKKAVPSLLMLGMAIAITLINLI
ncbi:MAG: DoxX family protein [Akkermansiaceae bacterium]